MTMPVSINPVENSGSLTGHILAQGWRDGPDTRRRSNVKVVVAMLVVLLVLVGVSVLFLFTAGNAFTDMIGGVFKRDLWSAARPKLARLRRRVSLPTTGAECGRRRDVDPYTDGSY